MASAHILVVFFFVIAKVIGHNVVCIGVGSLQITQFWFVSDIAIFVLKRDVKLQLTN